MVLQETRLRTATPEVLLCWLRALLFCFALALVAPSASCQVDSVDPATTMLLHMDGNLNGEQGQSPLQNMGVTYENGVFGSGAYFAPTNQVFYQNSGVIDPLEGSVEFWIKPRWNGSDGNSNIFLSYGDGGGILLFRNGTYLRSIFNRYGAAGGNEVGVGVDLSSWQADQWHHVAYTWSSSHRFLMTYVDGSLVGQATLTAALPGIGQTSLQLGADGAANGLDGVLDEFRISNRARTAGEIAQSYVNGLTISSMSIQPSTLQLYPTWTSSAQLTAVTDLGTVTIPNAVASWSTSNASVATVDAAGIVTATGAGSATVTAVVKGVSAPFQVNVTAPVLAPTVETPDPYLTAPATGCLYQIPVLVLRYLPTTDGVHLDPSYAGTSDSLTTVIDNTDVYDNQIKYMLEEGSRYHGYKDTSALPSLGYRVVKIINVYEPMQVSNYSNGADTFYPDYAQILTRFNVADMVNNLGVKEVWLWSYHYGNIAPAESKMSSPLTGDISNSIRYAGELPIYNTTYTLYNYNFTRTAAEAVHDHGHQLEATLGYAASLQDGNSDLFWHLFVGEDANGNRVTGRCGDTHSPPNTTVDYDWENPTQVLSDIEDWNPLGTGAKTLVNNRTWDGIERAWPYDLPPAQTDCNWYTYWFQNMPGRNTHIPHPNGEMTDWWRFAGDWDGAIASNYGLWASANGLTLSPSSLYGGAPAYGKVTLSSAAPAGGETVSLTSSSGSVTLPAAVTVPAGAASATFAMTTAAVTTDTPVTITATDGSATENATLTLLTKYNITGNLTKAGAPLSGASVTASATGSFLLTKNLATVQAIPDNDPTGITQTITVPDVGTITDLKLGLNLTHSYIADLVVTLTGPDGTSVVVHNRTGGSADDIVTSYPVLTTPDASLSAFNGKPTNGTWTLKVQDLDTADTGSLNAWDLTFTYNGAVTKTAATDSAGNYSLTGLKPATYSVVPAASGLTFSPTSRVVTLGPSRSGVNFTGYPAPTLSSFTPTSGPVGAAVTLTGTGFTGATSVKFHGTAASFTVSSDTQITATVPSGATTGTISVTTPGGTATSTGSFAVTVPPTITSFTPTSARVGKTVSLTGTGFTGATSVKFHGTAATTYTVNSDTKITATVPTGATTGTISVTTPLGTATSSAVFTVTVSAPVITSFTPTSGPAGTSVTLTGSNFTGASAVAFHGTSASFTVTSSTKITATVPTGATSGTISVTTAGGTATSSASFTVIPPPVLSSLSPTSAYAGGGSLSLSVTGANFVSGAVVHFGTTALATTFVSTTQLTATITSALRANVATFNVTVLNPDSQTSGGQPFVVKPRLTALTLAATRVSGGQSVTATVTLNGPAPTGGIAIALTSSDTARATVPASVTVPANATSATFAVTTLAVTSTGVTNIGASGAGGTFSAPLTTLAPLLTTADTFGQDGSSANTNFGTVNPLLVKTSTGTGSNRDTYLKFSLSGVTSITSARLVLTASLSGSGSQTSGVFGTSSGWTEGGLTWNTRPALGSSLGSVTVSGTSAAVYSVDVTSYVQSQVSGGVASFGLHNPSVSTLVTRIVSRELGTGAAQLILNGN